MYWSWFLVLAVSVSPGLASYHDKRQTYKVPGLHDDALFGFSVSSMGTGNKATLIVGAPKEDNIGGVYTCEPTTHNCSPIDRTGIERFEEDKRYSNQSYWLGATVAGTEDFFVACAPRFISKIQTTDSKNVGIFGRCYSFDDSSANATLLGSVLQSMLESTAKFEGKMDTFGWSIYIYNDTTYIGGPGMGSGRLIKIENGSNGVLSNGYTYGNYSQFNASFNFGYSVTTGEFKPRGKNIEIKTQVAVGSTYGSDGRGKVIFRPFSDMTLKSTNELVGPTVGSMYGATLCTASFNKNGKRSALLVGAPAFADYDGYNTGAVYVYTVQSARKDGMKEGFLPNPITMFAGDAPNSFFGSAIVNVGDINGDQIDDIAIAAPYYKNTGCVYIFSGAHLAIEGNKPEPLQKILPYSSATRTFGYSLGLLKDYDENGCAELAIGAPESNEVTVLNCIAVITVQLLKLPKTIPKGKGDVQKFLDVCLNVQFPDKPIKVNAEIKVEIDIHHNGASLKDPANGQLNFTIYKNDNRKKDTICKKIELLLNASGKYNKEITYKMKATHVPSEDKDFKPENVNLSVTSDLSKEDIIWVNECGNDRCLPLLKMTAKYSTESPYLIGTTDSIDARVSVKNSGNVAYDACMYFNVTGAEITKLPDNCTVLAANVLECRPRNLVYDGSYWNQDMSIDTSTLTNKNSTISATVTLFTECGNASTIYNNKDEKIFILNADAVSFNVTGRTDEGIDNMVNLTRGDIAAQKQFFHIYTIYNEGPTNWMMVPVKISVPKQDVATAVVYVDNKQCTNITTSLNETKYHCFVEFIPKHLDRSVQIIFTAVPDTLIAKIGQEDIIVQSNITVILNKIEKPKEVKSKLRLIEGVIPIWVIIVASILALIILVIIFFILRQCGCLKRNNKEDLKKVRMSVRRQTMMRHSMMVRSPPADQEMLVREAEASQESDKKKKDRRVIINDF